MKNQIKAGVILSYAIIAANVLVSICYTPIMLRTLGKSEYGLYTLVGSIISYMQLFSFGAGSAYVRFYYRYKAKKNEEQIKKLNGTFLSIFLFAALLVIICGAYLTYNSDFILGSKLTKEELKTAKYLIAILVVNMAVSMPNTALNAIINAKECFIFQRSVTLITIFAGPFVTMPLLFLGYGSVMLVTVTTVLTVAQTLINYYYCVKKADVVFKFSGFDLVLIKEIFFFSFFIFLNLIIDHINWNVDKYIIGRLIGTADVAVYGVASQIYSMIMIFSTSVSSVFVPRIHKFVSDGNKKDEINRLFIKVGRVQMMVLSFLITGYIFFGRHFVIIWAGKEYETAFATSLFLIIPAIIPLIQNLGIEIQRAHNKHKFRSVVYSIIAVGNICISVPLCRLYGPVGCAAGTGIAVLVGNGFIMNYYYKKYLEIDVKGFLINILKVLSAIPVPLALGVLIRRFVPFENIFKFLLSIAVYSAVFIIFMYLFGLNKNEKNILKMPLERIFKTR